MLRDLADARLITLDELAADVVVVTVRPIPRRIRGSGPFAAAHHPAAQEDT